GGRVGCRWASPILVPPHLMHSTLLLSANRKPSARAASRQGPAGSRRNGLQSRAGRQPPARSAPSDQAPGVPVGGRIARRAVGTEEVVDRMSSRSDRGAVGAIGGWIRETGGRIWAFCSSPDAVAGPRVGAALGGRIPAPFPAHIVAPHDVSAFPRAASMKREDV